MPKFIKFRIAIVAVLWIFWIYLLLFAISPNSYWEIFLFLGVLFFALGLTLSFIFYLFNKKKYPKFTDLKVLYKKGSKWGFFASFVIIGVAFLDAFHIMTTLNLFLFGLLCIGIFIETRGRK
ncbi:MAG TPA: hypothetical protein PLM44_00285 [bacterium]|jgi:hypothetical protein|nr:hypothetical protein [bacterium]